MVMSNIPKDNLPRVEDPSKTQKLTAAAKAAKSYQAVQGAPGSADSVNISEKSRLLQKLTKSYHELEASQSVKRNLVPITTLSSEEIVHSILKGTLFGSI